MHKHVPVMKTQLLYAPKNYTECIFWHVCFFIQLCKK